MQVDGNYNGSIDVVGSENVGKPKVQAGNTAAMAMEEEAAKGHGDGKGGAWEG